MQTRPTFLLIITVLFAIIGWLLATGSSKTQWVRLVDILLYGPFLLILAMKEPTFELTEPQRMLLLFLGATTITYNLKNFLQVR